MPNTLSPLENALEFRFSGSDRLYTDHDGRRVIVDVEGSGVLRILHAEPALLLVRGEEVASEFCPEFQNGAIVLADGPGKVFIQVLMGRSAPVEGGWIREGGNIFGAGWVIGATTEFNVDDRHEPSPTPSPEFPIPFYRRIKGVGKWNVIPDLTTACKLVDSFSIDDDLALKARGFKVQNLSAISTLESSYTNGFRETRAVASHLNAASFTTAIPPNNQGLILRKTYDRFHGRQRARVFVDGVFAGVWFLPAENRVERWHQSEFGIPASLTRGKSSVQITIDPPAGVALWSVSLMEIFAL